MLDTDNGPTKKPIAQLKQQNDPRVLGQGDVFDNYPTFKKRAGAAAVPSADPNAIRQKKAKAAKKQDASGTYAGGLALQPGL
ncbi:MAG: hypothetical protein HZA90_27485 [Verrucomicrobia bacterium]|nr:hypothetical protein [Verrucomicrobiota bacterium]